MPAIEALKRIAGMARSYKARLRAIRRIIAPRG